MGTNEPRHSKTILDFHGHNYSKVIVNKLQRGRNMNLYFGTINKGHTEFHQDRTLFTYSSVMIFGIDVIGATHS